MYDLGDTVALTFPVTDADGWAADATDVMCTITLPDGTTASPEVIHVAVGTYTASYTPASVGHYDVAWVATGTNASAFTDAFNVYAAGAQLLSLAEAKDAVNFTTTDHDAELRYYLAAATDLIERHVGPILHRAVTEVVDARGGRIRLATTPVVSLTSVVPVMAGGVTYDVNGLTVSPDGVVLSLNRVAIVPDRYDVTYVAGRTGPIPHRWLQAARLLVQHLWSTQRGSSSPGRNRGGDTYPTGSAFTMPNRVLELLQWDLNGPLVG
jgi:hypothetical protein